MKLALYGLVIAALLALGSGCATYSGPIGARPGSGCDTAFADTLWSDSCDTTCNGSTGPDRGFGCGSAFDALFGGGVCTAGCATSNCDRGCSDQNCPGGRLDAGPAPRPAAQPIRQTLGHVGQTVAAIPHNMQNRCANGFCGQAMGPTQGSVQYPYYTTRGPRDFFLANPPSIGP